MELDTNQIGLSLDSIFEGPAGFNTCSAEVYGALDVYNVWLLSAIVGTARPVPELRADLCL